MATSLPDFPPFDTESEPTSLGIQWEKWILRLENLFVALDIKDKVRQKALLLHYGGANLADIYYTLASEDDKEYQQVKEKLQAHFEPKVNVTFETYNFRQLAQEPNESVDKFVTRLREAANRCDFHDKDREIKDQIVQKCLSERLRRKALREDPSLSNLLSAARAMETADAQAKAMESPAILKVSQQAKSSKERVDGPLRKNKEHTGQSEGERKECFNCGGLWPHSNGRKSCPAWGIECRKCGKKNHYAKKCKSTTKVRKIDNLSGSESEDEYRVSAVQQKTARGHTITVKVDEIPLQVQIDSGADVNIVDEDSFDKLKGQVTLSRSRAKLFAYNSTTPLPLLGKFTAVVSTKKRFEVADFYVVKGSRSSGCLLGSSTAVSLGILHIVNRVKTKSCKFAGAKPTPHPPKKGDRSNNCTPGGQERLQKLVKSNDDLFHGIGKLKGVKVKLHVDPNVQPVAQRHRRVPFHLRDKVEVR